MCISKENHQEHHNGIQGYGRISERQWQMEEYRPQINLINLQRWWCQQGSQSQEG